MPAGDDDTNGGGDVPVPAASKNSARPQLQDRGEVKHGSKSTGATDGTFGGEKIGSENVGETDAS